MALEDVNKSNSDIPNGKGIESVSKVLTPEGAKRLQLQLAEFNQSKMQEYRSRRAELAVLARKDLLAGKGNKDEEVLGLKDWMEKLHRERSVNYREILKDKGGDPAAFAFAEITDQKFNKEAFKRKDGWLDEFHKSPEKNSGSLEEFALKKQYKELNVIRETLLENKFTENIFGKIGDIFPDLAGDGDEKMVARKGKNDEVSESAKDYFKNQSADIEKLLSAKSPDEKAELKKKLSEGFKKDVFKGAKEDAATDDIISKLFDDLVNDYQAMKDSMAKMRKLNPKMVQLLLNDVSEEDWDKELAKEAELQAKKLDEKNKVVKEQDDVTKVSAPADIDAKSSFYGGNLSASELIDSGTELKFVRIGDGRYKIEFPSDGLNGNQESEFSVRKIKTGAGERLAFGFNDPLMDKPAVVGKDNLKSQINGLYLEHIMHDSVKRDKDYQGPDLNDIIHDGEMYALASMLFAPKNLAGNPISKSEADNFKKVMQLLVNTANNGRGEGIYGNLLPIRNRVALLKHALASSSEMPARFSALLSKLGTNEVKNMSLEEFCSQKDSPGKLLVERNDGNFSKN